MNEAVCYFFVTLPDTIFFSRCYVRSTRNSKWWLSNRNEIRRAWNSFSTDDAEKLHRSKSPNHEGPCLQENEPFGRKTYGVYSNDPWIWLERSAKQNRQVSLNLIPFVFLSRAEKSLLSVTLRKVLHFYGNSLPNYLTLAVLYLERSFLLQGSSHKYFVADVNVLLT